MNKTFYRPEIDGLRAVAVVSVVVYHADLALGGYEILPGGFLGVDVFFVISGYLISSLLLRELKATGTIGFRNFYERRVRRILPMLLIVVVSTVFPAWFLLYPSPFSEFAQSILATLGFASNVYFHISGLEYTAADSIFKPLLHTWSLSVEEQFYIIFPLMLLLAYRKAPSQVERLITLGMIFSLSLAIWSTTSSPSMGFYYLHTRMWELLAGTLLAWCEIHRRNIWTDVLPASVLSMVGFGLILLPMFFFSNDTPHPSHYTLVPVFGACLIIRYGSQENFVSRLLTTKLFVGLGMVSYSFYLWHFPILSFYEISVEDPRWDITILLILGALALAIVSFFLVERPTRDRKRVAFSKLLAAIALISMLLLAFSLYVISNDGMDSRFARYQLLYEKNEFDNQRLAVESWKHLQPEEPYFQKGKGVRVLFIGDSHSKDLFNVFHLNQPLFEGYQFTRMGTKWDNGYLIRRDGFEKLSSYPNYRAADVVVLSSKYFLQELPRVIQLIQFLKNDGKKVVITSKGTFFETEKKDSYTQYDLMMREAIDDGFVRPNFDLVLAEKMYQRRVPELSVEINRLLKEISHQQQVMYLEKDAYQCDQVKKICDGVTDDGFKIYYDSGHYTLEGAKYFGKKIYEMGWFKVED